VVIEEIREEIKNFQEFNENENTTLTEPMGHRKGKPKRKAYNHKYILKTQKDLQPPNVSQTPRKTRKSET
jgi:hypothetical protein